MIPVSEPNLCGNEKKYVDECIKTNWITVGKFIPLFEKKFAKYVGTKYAQTCSNGTAALHLVMMALGIGKGDEVIVPTLTFVSSANAVAFTGAKPVFVDSEKDTGNIDVSKVEKKITKKTKAVMAVHLYGHTADMAPLKKLCIKHKLTLIEDAAEALGSKYKGKMAGSLGDVATFSFYGNKTITSGEGGMITSNDKELMEKIRMLKDQGKPKGGGYLHTIIGYNYRMTNIQAAIGLAQLENINKFIKKKREIAKYYKRHIKSNAGIIVHSIEKNKGIIPYSFTISYLIVVMIGCYMVPNSGMTFFMLPHAIYMLVRNYLKARKA